jgi:hypothetical protein
VRWFSWVTGVPVLVMIFISGITGYWLVWDRLAQYVAIVSSEWLDRLGISGSRWPTTSSPSRPSTAAFSR